MASVNNRPVATCRTPRTTRWRRSAAKQKDTTTTMWSEHVVFSDRPGELPAARIGGVVVFGRTSFRDVRIPCGPPWRICDGENERGGANLGADSDAPAGRGGADYPLPDPGMVPGRGGADYPPDHARVESCSAGAETACSTCAADSPLEYPKCPCEANREIGKCRAKSYSKG